MIDLSDGLSTDLEHICQESHVGAEIEAEAIPRAQVGRRKRAGQKRVALDLALHGGDDYELLFTSAAAVPRQIAGVRVTRIGRTTRSAGMRLIGRMAKRGRSKPRDGSTSREIGDWRLVISEFGSYSGHRFSDAKTAENPAPGGAFENCRKSRPGGAFELSPALQRWEEVGKSTQVPEGRPSPQARTSGSSRIISGPRAVTLVTCPR